VNRRVLLVSDEEWQFIELDLDVKPSPVIMVERPEPQRYVYLGLMVLLGPQRDAFPGIPVYTCRQREMRKTMSSDREAMQAALAHAEAARPYMALSVEETETTILVSTGPDDADAVFFFDPNGKLTHVAVVEAHGEIEARIGPIAPLAITEDR